MTATTHSAGDGSPDPIAASEPSQATAPETGASPGLLVGMASADRCANCGAEMAVDQRYCVECGIRRGRPRFSMTPAGGAAASTAVVPQGPSGARPTMTLVAVGLVIVLLALGVGVLIGHDGGKQPVHVTVSGAGTGAGQSSSGGSAAKPKSSSSSGNTSTGSSTAPTKTNFFGG